MRSTRRTAALVFLLAVLAGAPARAEQESGTAADASRSFREGQQLFEKADYVGAIESFQRAYKLKPHFSVLCNIALSYERLGNLVRAAERYRDCLTKGAEQAGNGDVVRNSLQRVEGRITWVAVRSPGKGGSVYLDGLFVGPAPQRVPVNPGTHVVEVRRAGADPARFTITTRGGEQRDVELAPADVAGPKPIIVVKERVRTVSRRTVHQAWFWGGLGLSVALATVATVLGVQTLGLRDDYEAAPTRQLLDKGTARRTLTNVFWGLTAAAAGTTTVLFFFTDFSRHREQPATPVSLGVGLRGTF